MQTGGAAVVVVTWNVHGASGVEVAEVVERLRSLTGRLPDVLVCQEIRRRQARRLADAMGAAHRWHWKHWPILSPTEGLAVFVRGEISRSRSRALRRAWFWSWRRRIVTITELVTAAGDELVVGGFHLTSGTTRGDEPARRAAELQRSLDLTVRAAKGRPAVLAGDLNDHPGSPAQELAASAGWIDGWAVVHGDPPEPAGATNWTPGDRRGRPPTQRIDVVLVPSELHVADAVVGAPDPEGAEQNAADHSYDEWARLSDHLPVAAVVGG